EVQAALAEHAAVREVVVVGQRSPQGGTALVAYVVPSSPPSPEAGELRTFLLERLPSYMVPEAFVFLQRLPTMSNLKLDVTALPSPELSSPARSRGYVAPRNPIEEVLAGIWADLLARDEIGVEDDFFDLGGHSLLATRVISRVREAFRVDLALRDLFDRPTVADLARGVTAAEVQPGRSDKIARLLLQIQQMSNEERERALQQSRKQVEIR
ncbi:MAG TPA: phosphopantetheine-binding protein, partial [Thermoanaerobaculia bacterium]|nr:phosphopantetheine-binding protein [Thermoanaerobaculia bacterium]